MGIEEDVYKIMHGTSPVFGKTSMGINLVGKIEKKL